jgi:ACR3 family arsenite transporter
MALFAWIFFTKIYRPFIDPAQAVNIYKHVARAAPCTAMVFVWSYLSDGNPNYTLVQVAGND